jgi:hypothetical protein
MSTIQDLIPEVFPSQKHHMNMDSFLSCYIYLNNGTSWDGLSLKNGWDGPH